jgi:hypothetical protein
MFLALIVAAQCALNNSEAQLRFAYCFCSATFLKLRAHPGIYCNVYISDISATAWMFIAHAITDAEISYSQK